MQLQVLYILFYICNANSLNPHPANVENMVSS